MALSTLDMPDLRVLVGLEYPRASKYESRCWFLVGAVRL
jgi:hypothetical protein